LDQHALVSIADVRGQIEYINSKFCGVSGYTPEELIGQNHSLINSGHHSREFWREFWRTIASGKTWQGEICNRSKFGKIYWVSATITPFTDAQGKIERYVAIRVDITARKLAEQELRDSEERYKIVLEGSSAGLWDWDLTTDTVHYSARFRGLLGAAESELTDTIVSFEERLHCDDHERVMAAWQDHLDTGRRFDVDCRLMLQNGDYRWFNIRGQALWDEKAKPCRMAGSLMDVHPQKCAEAALLNARNIAEAANQAKSEFVAVMSHEIRTQMNAVVGFTELLFDTTLGANQRNYVETIQRSGQSLIAIINDVLDYSKIEAGKLDVECVDFDAISLAEIAVRTLSLQAQAKSIALTVQFEPEIPRGVSADYNRVGQVLMNLLGNAIKFTKQGGVTLEVKTITANEIPCLRFNVIDTGMGIPVEQQGKLFTKFTQATVSTSREFGGTGLGLAICKRLVELMRGQIGLESVAGEGSTFWFTLPLATGGTLNTAGLEVSAPDAATRERSAPLVAQEKSNRIWEVLVADDNQLNQQLASAFLIKLNCHPQIAQNGEEAAYLVTQHRFDLVLMDYQMPKLNGLEATAAIRHWESFQPQARRLPIIALTANYSYEFARHCLAGGMDGSLAKPLIFKELARVIANLETPRSLPLPVNPAPDDKGPSGPMDTAVPEAGGANHPVAGPRVASSEVMDHARALQLTDNNPELLGLLANAFLEQCDGLLTGIRQALAKRDAQALQEFAHKLKGSISVFAATSVQVPVLALNKFPVPPDWTQLNRHGRDLEREIGRLRPELEELNRNAVR